jgi:tRNA-dihydrouridine synthase C
MRSLLPNARPALVLAPMQDVTDLAFMRVIARRGAPDWFVTEYFRVHPDSVPSAEILRSIDENETGSPIFAQMIGSDVPSLVRTAKLLESHPVAGIDLNLGCPAPIVCRKNAGGGLLRNPDQVDAIIGALRDAISGIFTVKTRVGYHHHDEFPVLLEIFRRHGIDGLTIHGRTVIERYQTPVHPECVRLAVATMSCPVIANGNVVDTASARSYHEASGAAGLMVGRGAIRNPWIFQQINAAFSGEPIFRPTHRDLLEYIIELDEEIAAETRRLLPDSHVQRLKKHLAYICHGINEGTFEHEMRRARNHAEFRDIRTRHLDHATVLPDLPPSPSKIFCGFEELVG